MCLRGGCGAGLHMASSRGAGGSSQGRMGADGGEMRAVYEAVAVPGGSGPLSGGSAALCSLRWRRRVPGLRLGQT